MPNDAKAGLSMTFGAGAGLLTAALSGVIWTCVLAYVNGEAEWVGWVAFWTSLAFGVGSGFTVFSGVYYYLFAPVPVCPKCQNQKRVWSEAA